MRTRPFLSVVIPTRDRPDLLRSALWSVANQADGDLEIIVSDNPENEPAEHVFEEVLGGHPSATYLRADEPLDMVENWNRAISCARGEYVTLLEDKFALHLDAVVRLKSVVAQLGDREIFNWSADVYKPNGEGGACRGGEFFERVRKGGKPFEFEPAAVAGKRFSFDVERGREGGMYGIGKIVFGAYHRDLVERIRSRTGKVFHEFAPDYTSMCAALLLAKSAVDVGESYCVAVSSSLSNGNLCQRSVSHAERFYASFGPLEEAMSALPIRGLPTACHNIVGHAYIKLLSLLPDEGAGCSVNMAGLYLRCESELGLAEWENEEERGRHYRRLRDARSLLPLAGRARLCLLRLLEALKFKTLAGKVEAGIYRWNPGSYRAIDPAVWDLWTDGYALRLQGLGFGLIDALKYRYLGRLLMPNENPDPASPSGGGASSPFLDEVEGSSPELRSLIRTLIDTIDSRDAAYQDDVDALKTKLANFRGMIDRRDRRIEKLEGKLAK